MSNCDYRLLQVTNQAVGAVATGAYMPFGITTRLIEKDCARSTFDVTTSNVNVISINEHGYYKINYDASLVIADAGTITLQLQIGGVTVYTFNLTVAAAGTYSVSFTFMTRAFHNIQGLPTNLPLVVQVLNSGVALTGGVSNIIVERTSSL